MLTINMLSSATKVKGQGVSSAYIEQVNLVKNGLKYLLRKGSKTAIKDLASQEYDANFNISEGQVYKYFSRDIHCKELHIEENLLEYLESLVINRHSCH